MMSLEKAWSFRASHSYHIAEKIDLLECIQELERIQKLPRLGPETKHLHIYCDELQNGGSLENDTLIIDIPTAVKIDRLSIFCRRFYVGLNQPRTIVFPQSNLIIRIVFGTAPKELLICDGQRRSFGLTKELKEIVDGVSSSIAKQLQDPVEVESGLSVGSECAGVEYRIRNSEFSRKALPQVHGSEIDEYGLSPFLGEGIQPHDSLHKLLNWLFSYASNLMLQGVGKESDCIEALEFIQLCAYNSVRCSHLCSSSQELLTRLSIPRRYPSIESTGKARPTLFVPVLNVNNQLEELVSFLDQWTSIKKTADDLEHISASREERQRQTREILKSISKSGLPSVPNELNEGDVSDSLKDVEAKREDLAVANEAAEVARQAFFKGIESFKKEKESKLIWTCVMEGFKVAISLGVAIATCGAGAPVTVLNVKAAVEEISKPLSAWQKLWNIVKKMIDTLSRVLPKLWSSFTSYSKFASIDNVTRKAKDLVIQKRNKEIRGNTTSTPIDYLGLMADWEEYKVELDEMFKEIEDIAEGSNVISGSSNFRSAMRKVVIRGQTVLEAQRHLYEASNIYYRGLRETQIRIKRCAEIGEIAESYEVEDNAHQSMISHLQLDLLNIKRDIFLQLHSCLLSLAYLSTSAELADIEASPDLTLHAFSKCVVEFRKRWTEAMEPIRDLQRIPRDIVIGTDDSKNLGTVFPVNWASIFQNEQRIDFKIPHTIPKLKGYYQVRIEDMHLTLEAENEQSRGSEDFTYDLRFGPQMVDKNKFEQPVQYWISPFSLRKEGKKGTWIDELKDYVKPALFCHGSVFVDLESLTSSGWDVRNVKNVKMAFTCRGISKRRPE